MKKITLFFLSLISTFFWRGSDAELVAQTTSSPYSRYGIGDLSGKGLAQGFAMGGANIAMQNDSTAMFFINTGNPASYSNIRLTTADLGMNFNRIKLESADAEKIINNASLAYLTLAFPFKKWWVGSIGLIPYSSVGYKVSNHQNIDNIGGVDFLYQGSGGVNQVYFGNGIKPFLKRKKSWQSLSLGFNASYLFGGFDDSRRSIFPYGSHSFNSRTVTTTRVGGVYFDYGAQYSYTFDSLRGRDLKENVKLLLGATFATQANVNAQADSLSYTYTKDNLGREFGKDTIQNTQNTKGQLQFPLSFGFGLGIKKGDRWVIAGDFAIQNWSTYKAFNKLQELKNSMRVSLGVQYVPNSKANGKGAYFKRMYYRMGGRYNQTMIELKNTPLTETALSLGIGFPVARNFLLQSFSMVNIGVELGQRGTTTNGLIKEQFFKASIGFTINDRWFIKPKFD